MCSFIYGGIAQYKFFTRIGQPVSFFSAAASCAVGVILGIIIAGKVSGKATINLINLYFDIFF